MGQSEPVRFENIKELLRKMDADHLHELQLGGADQKSALWMLDKKVNRSLGAQIQSQLKDVPIGTKITDVITKGFTQ